MQHVNQEFLMYLEEAEIECWKSYLSGTQKFDNNPLQ